MALPVQVMVHVLHLGHALRQAHLDKERLRLNMQLQTHIASLQQEYVLARLDAEKEVVLEVLAISKHAFDRKMDFFTDIFSKVHELIARHQAELIDEQSKLKDRRFDDNLSRNDRMRIDARIGELNVTLIDLNTFSRSLATDFGELSRSLNPI